MRTRSGALFETSHIHGNSNWHLTSVNNASLRNELDAYEAAIASWRKGDKSINGAEALLDESCRMLEILIAAFLKKTAKKTNKNSDIPPSQTGNDETRKSPPKKRTPKRGRHRT